MRRERQELWRWSNLSDNLQLRWEGSCSSNEKGRMMCKEWLVRGSCDLIGPAAKYWTVITRFRLSPRQTCQEAPSVSLTTFKLQSLWIFCIRLFSEACSSIPVVERRFVCCMCCCVFCRCVKNYSKLEFLISLGTLARRGPARRSASSRSLNVWCKTMCIPLWPTAARAGSWRSLQLLSPLLNRATCDPYPTQSTPDLAPNWFPKHASTALHSDFFTPSRDAQTALTRFLLDLVLANKVSGKSTNHFCCPLKDIAHTYYHHILRRFDTFETARSRR